jgi:hypothetical protein
MVTFVDTEPLRPQIDSIVLTARQLEFLKLSIDDKVPAYIIALRLPDSYDTLKTILCNTESAKLSSTGVASQILAEEQRRIRTSGGNAVAFYAKAKRLTRTRTRTKSMAERIILTGVMGVGLSLPMIDVVRQGNRSCAER